MFTKLVLLFNSLFRKTASDNQYLASTFFEDIRISDVSGKDNGNGL